MGMEPTTSGFDCPLPSTDWVGSFSNDDCDGSENVTIKTNSRFLSVVAIIPTRFKCQM